MSCTICIYQFNDNGSTLLGTTGPNNDGYCSLTAMAGGLVNPDTGTTFPTVTPEPVATLIASDCPGATGDTGATGAQGLQGPTGVCENCDGLTVSADGITEGSVNNLSFVAGNYINIDSLVTSPGNMTITISGSGISGSGSGGCLFVEPLYLSDTFNTWFERTNEMIEVINSIQLLGVEVKFDTSVNGYFGQIIEEQVNSCYLQTQLIYGPFIGPITTNSSYYGSGTASNPYKLTIKFPTDTTLTKENQISNSDELIVNDNTSIPVKKIRAENILPPIAKVNSFRIEKKTDSTVGTTFHFQEGGGWSGISASNFSAERLHGYLAATGPVIGEQRIPVTNTIGLIPDGFVRMPLGILVGSNSIYDPNSSTGKLEEIIFTPGSGVEISGSFQSNAAEITIGAEIPEGGNGGVYSLNLYNLNASYYDTSNQTWRPVTGTPNGPQIQQTANLGISGGIGVNVQFIPRGSMPDYQPSVGGTYDFDCIVLSENPNYTNYVRKIGDVMTGTLTGGAPPAGGAQGVNVKFHFYNNMGNPCVIVGKLDVGKLEVDTQTETDSLKVNGQNMSGSSSVDVENGNVVIANGSLSVDTADSTFVVDSGTNQIGMNNSTHLISSNRVAIDKTNTGVVQIGYSTDQNGKKLFVNGTSLFNGNMTVNNGVVVNGGFTSNSGDVDINGSVDISQDLNVASEISTGSLDVLNDISVGNDLIVDGNLVVGQGASFGQPISINYNSSQPMSIGEISDQSNNNLDPSLSQVPTIKSTGGILVGGNTHLKQNWLGNNVFLSPEGYTLIGYPNDAPTSWFAGRTFGGAGGTYPHDLRALNVSGGIYTDKIIEIKPSLVSTPNHWIFVAGSVSGDSGIYANALTAANNFAISTINNPTYKGGSVSIGDFYVGALNIRHNAKLNVHGRALKITGPADFLDNEYVTKNWVDDTIEEFFHLDGNNSYTIIRSGTSTKQISHLKQTINNTGQPNGSSGWTQVNNSVFTSFTVRSQIFTTQIPNFGNYSKIRSIQGLVVPTFPADTDPRKHFIYTNKTVNIHSVSSTGLITHSCSIAFNGYPDIGGIYGGWASGYPTQWEVHFTIISSPT